MYRETTTTVIVEKCKLVYVFVPINNHYNNENKNIYKIKNTISHTYIHTYIVED